LAASCRLFVGGFGPIFFRPRKVAAAGQKCDYCGENNPKYQIDRGHGILRRQPRTAPINLIFLDFAHYRSRARSANRQHSITDLTTQKLRQLGDVRGDAPRRVLAQALYPLIHIKTI